MSEIGQTKQASGDAPEFTNILLDAPPKKKQPKRILHFSDGILEEYSSDEEDETNSPPSQPPVDPKTLTWLPWCWYYITTAASKTFSAADFCGEKLAWFLGITSPKYQYAIDEYYRLKEEEEKEKARMQQLNTELSSVDVKIIEDTNTDQHTEKY